ncbi:kinase-like domain-containing protein [Rhizophagus clarus]|uniref:Kinase-like domain-containing protein n=1 Tax=Rhizophagus clarus TaxID=94130 RepID=A0A8H3L8A7_9GLOM|nr:kinase-like domain-containing protein [Rhizophagus clarus]
MFKKIVEYFRKFGTSGNKTIDQFIFDNYLKWIPYNEFKNIKYLDAGGFSIIYKAVYKDYEVVLKHFGYFNNLDESLNEFLNEWKIINESDKIINIYGFTKHPITSDYMLIMEYANKGSLRGCLTEITNNWEQKLYRLYEIIAGLDKLHKDLGVHYDFHDGNILYVKCECTCRIYISDYFKPYQFAKSYLKKGYICGERPEIIEGTIPQCYIDLMKRCWNNNPLKRPTVSEVLDIIKKWVIPPDSSMKIKDIDKKLKSDIMEFIKAPTGYSNIISESHPQACYTSRILDFTSEELNKILEGSLESFVLKFFKSKQKEKDSEQKFIELEKINEENKMELVDLRQKNSQFERDIQDLRLDLAKQIKKFAEKENTLQTKITYFQNEIYEKKALTSNLTEQLELNKFSIQQIQIQIDQLKKEKSDLQEKLTQTEVNIKELKSQHESLIEQKKQLEIELSQSQVICNQMEQEKIDLHNMMRGFLQDQKFTAKLKAKCAKLKKEITQLEQKLNNEEQIKVQLTQAIQIKEDKINELEQILINIVNKEELSVLEKRSVNESTSGKNTEKIHKEKEETIGLQQEISKTSTSYDASSKGQVLYMSNFDKVIEELKQRFNELESSLTTNSEKGNRIHLDFSMMAEEINLLRNSLDRLELRLKQEENELKNLAAD